MTRAGRALIIVAAATTLCWGCGPADSALIGNSPAELLGGQRSGDFGLKLQEAERHWQNRGQRDELDAAIVAWETAIEIETPNMDEATRRAAVFAVYIRLARAHYLLGDAALPLSGEAKAEEKAEAAFDKGRTYAERAMGVYSPAFLEAVKSGKSIGEAAKAHLDVGAVPAMFWWATDLGRWLNTQGGLTALAYLDNLKEVSHRAHALDPTYFHHSPTSYLGGYYTRLPLPSGDMKASKRHFESAVSSAPGCLQHQVAFAEHYAVAARDRELFRALLNGVLATPANIEPSLEPENTFAKAHAKRLLDQIDELF